jgi:hypothetical protein
VAVVLDYLQHMYQLQILAEAAAVTQTTLMDHLG